ncbi:MAG: hypothetical protein ABJN65_07275 [Parasphingorhabdus sp.]
MNRIIKLLTALAAPLILTGCFFLPGKFDATLKLLQGGQYEFSYVGEMQIFSGDEKDMKQPVLKPFDLKKAKCSDWVEADGSRSPSSYYDSYTDSADAAEAAADAAEAVTEADGSPKRENRQCTDEELTELEEQEKAIYERRKKDYDQRSGMMAAMFGGAVPGNDEALKKFAANLSKYDGWDKVEYAGDNVFNVEYRASGNFDRYFGFPIINDASMQYPFFQIVPRKSGELELQAPGLGSQGGVMGMAMLGGMPGARASQDMPIKPIEGSFTLETNGEVLGNNSPDGYTSEGDLKVMRWNVKNLTESPRALIKVN